MKYDDTDNRHIELELDKLPVSGSSLALGNHFMLSDNLQGSEESEMLDVANLIKEGMFNTPFRLRFNMMMLCTSGRMLFRINMRDYEMTPGNMLIIIEGATGECLEISPDARLMVMVFSSGFDIIKSGIRPSAELIAHIERHPMFRLDEDEINGLTTVYRMLKSRLTDKDFILKEEFAVSCMRMVFCYTSGHIVTSDTTALTEPNSRQQEIFSSFLSLVEKYCCRERSQAFYADKLCISNKYLSRVVKEASGRTPREWICIRIIIEAKLLLRQSNLTIQQISDRLNFPNQSFFGTFFKHQTGMSPGRYRK